MTDIDEKRLIDLNKGIQDIGEYAMACQKIMAWLLFIEALELSNKFTTTYENCFNTAYQRNRSFKYLVDIYRTRYSPQLGDNQWAVYNALTHWATHSSANRKFNTANVDQRRAETVQKFISLGYLEAA